MATATLDIAQGVPLPPTPTLPQPAAWTLFPAPDRKPHGKSVRAPVRDLLPPSAPPTSPRNLGAAFIQNRNAEKIAEVCRGVSAELSRGRSLSSGGSTPDLTDDHTDSDASQDDETDQITMTEFIQAYSDLSNATRFADQEFTARSVMPIKQAAMVPDRVWATDISTTLEVALPSPGSPAHALYQKYEQEQAVKTRMTRELHHSRSFGNLQRSPPRRRIPRNHPDVLSTLPMPRFALSAAPHSAPLPYPKSQQDRPQCYRPAAPQTKSPTRPQANFETWPPRSNSSTSVPTLASNFSCNPTAAPTIPLPPLPRPSRPRAHTGPLSRPSTAPGTGARSPLSEIFPPVPPLEKSFWEHDDDDVSPKKGHSKSESIGKIFHVRNLSGSSKKDTELVPIVAEIPVPEKKVRGKRTASDVWRTMFGIGCKKTMTT